MLYEDGFIVDFQDGTNGLFSEHSPYSQGPVISEEDYTIKDDDSLFSIANAKYGDTRFWYIIAEWNAMLDILELVTGTAIKIPRFG